MDGYVISECGFNFLYELCVYAVFDNSGSSGSTPENKFGYLGRHIVCMILW